MIGHYLSGRAMPGDVLQNDTYVPSMAVTGSRLLGDEHAARLTVLFPPWHGGGQAYRMLEKRLARSGYAVLSYDFSDHILGLDTDAVLASYETIKKIVTADLDALKKRNGYEEVDAIAASLGNVAMTYVADDASFSSATLVVPGCSLATSLWDGSRTQNIREGLERQGMTKSELDIAWSDLAPQSHAPTFKNTPVRYYLSKADTIIPTRYQEDMAKSLEESDVEIELHTTTLGHYMTVAKYCLFGKLPN